MLEKDELYRLYVIEMKTSKEIAAIVGVCSSSICNWLKKYGIPIRHGRSAQMPAEPNKETLFDLYITQGFSIDKIAQCFGSSEISISKLMDVYQIQKRLRWCRIAGYNAGKKMSDEQRATLSKIAKQRIGDKSPRYGAVLSEKTKQKIANSLKGRFRGADNPQWRGGHKNQRRAWHSRHEYKEWRNAVFQRDNYTCQKYGKPSNGDIQAHHIETWYEAPELRFEISNGIALCESCHRFIKGKECEYIEIFRAILQSNQQTQNPDTLLPL